jgi:hypothetical protein
VCLHGHCELRRLEGKAEDNWTAVSWSQARSTLHSRSFPASCMARRHGLLLSTAAIGRKNSTDFGKGPFWKLSRSRQAICLELPFETRSFRKGVFVENSRFVQALYWTLLSIFFSPQTQNAYDSYSNPASNARARSLVDGPATAR